MEPQTPWIAKVILRRKSKAGSILLHDFKLCYKATVMKTVWYAHKTVKLMEQNGDTRNKSIHLCVYYNKVINDIQWGKDSLFNKGC